MNTFILLFIIVIGVLAIGLLYMTWRTGKEQEAKIDQRAKHDDFEDEVERSWQYERSSLRKNIPNLTFIFVSIFIVILITALIFVT